jgi:alpha-L-rhamnosidase
MHMVLLAPGGMLISAVSNLTQIGPVKSTPGGVLTYATAELHSIYGMIRSAWTQEEDVFDWHITVPANTTAIVYVPTKDISYVTENGQPMENTNGLTFLRMENGFAVFGVLSGSYFFSSRLA